MKLEPLVKEGFFLDEHVAARRQQHAIQQIACHGRRAVGIDRAEGKLPVGHTCWRRFKIDQTCRLNFDQGLAPGF